MKQFARKTYSTLLDWKNNDAGTTAIRLEGARRVGKTTLVRMFATEYRSSLIIDFTEEDENVKHYFRDFNSNNIDLFFSRLELHYRTKLYRRESLIVFDEVQRFPRAREILKFLIQDGRFDYIETGSLISLKQNVRNIQIPSEERLVYLYPMDFEEFLWATGDTETPDMLKRFFDARKPLGAAHADLMRKYRTYLVIGGMPQVVSQFVANGNIMDADERKRSILNLYADDLLKIPNSNTGARARRLFQGLPNLLSSPRKVFLPGRIDRGTRTSQYSTALEWLTLARIFNKCIRVRDPGVAINLTADSDVFKCYLLDTGLLLTLAFGNNRKGLAETYDRILSGDLSVNEGMFFENAIAQELAAHGHDLRFCELEKDGYRSYEVDFVLPEGADRVSPIEVKSGRSAKHRSLDVMMERYPERIGNAYVVHTGDLRTDNGVTYIPAYMAMFL